MSSRLRKKWRRERRCFFAFTFIEGERKKEVKNHKRKIISFLNLKLNLNYITIKMEYYCSYIKLVYNDAKTTHKASK